MPTGAAESLQPDMVSEAERFILPKYLRSRVNYVQCTNT
jgi:hypothetical protein